jgi:hypothetical protein
MRGLLILGIFFVKSYNIDVFMAPLIKELQELWKGCLHGMCHHQREIHKSLHYGPSWSGPYMIY